MCKNVKLLEERKKGEEELLTLKSKKLLYFIRTLFYIDLDRVSMKYRSVGKKWPAEGRFKHVKHFEKGKRLEIRRTVL